MAAHKSGDGYLLSACACPLFLEAAGDKLGACPRNAYPRRIYIPEYYLHFGDAPASTQCNAAKTSANLWRAPLRNNKRFLRERL